MPFLTRTLVNGKPHHAIEYGDKPNPFARRLGTETRGGRIEISDKVAGAGLDALTAIYFPEAPQDGE